MILDGTSGSPGIYKGNGDGTFNTSAIYIAPLPLDSFITSASIGNVIANGHPDLVVQYTNINTPSAVAVFLGDGAGNFTPDTNAYSTGPASWLFPLPGFLARLNNQAPSLPGDNTLDYLFTNDGVVTSLLNLLNPTPTTPALLPSKTTLTASAASAAPTQQLIFTATVTGATPTGNVSFASGATTLGTASITNGTAALSASYPAAGTYSVTATYTGDTNNAPSSSAPATLAIAPVISATTLSVSAANTGVNQQLSFTATVTGFNPTGNVTFTSGTTTLRTAAVTNGIASLPYTFTAAGSYIVTASYAGNVANLASTSSPVTVVIAAPDYTITASPSSATINPGQSATTTLTVTPVGGYMGAVKFSCGTLPAGATCTFAPASVTPASGAASTTLTVTTTAPTIALLKDLTRPLQGIALASLIFFALSPRRTHLLNHQLMRAGFLTLLLVTCLLSISGCSSSSPGNPTNPGTPTGAQTITVTAAGSSGSLSHTINFQVTVQ